MHSNKEEPQDWFFTFGCGQYGGRLQNKFVRIYGRHEEARAQMVEEFGFKWALQYDSEAAAGVKEFRLTELTR